MKKFTCLSLMLAGAAAVSAQGVADIMQYANTDIVGTARYMGMAGAFNALGGDISTLSQNPAGIGIYRSSEVVVTAELGGVETQSQIGSNSYRTTGTDITKSKFNIGANNLGYVGTFFTGNRDGLISFNVGFAYNRQAYQKRRYGVAQNNMRNGVSDYIADLTNQWGGSSSDLSLPSSGSSNSYDPYYDSSAPWLSILGYNAYVINPKSGSSNSYLGLYANDGNMLIDGELAVSESRRIDEYTFNVGGNVSNLVYWGLGIGVSDITQTQRITYDEYYYTSSSSDYQNFRLNNYLKTTGTGVNAKFGLIVRPAPQFRFGMAIHTPTWYQMSDNYGAEMQSYNVEELNGQNTGFIYTPNDVWDYKLRTPWKFQFGAAYIIGRSGLISFDYEHCDYSYMHLSSDDGYYNTYSATNADIKNQLQGVNTFRVGGEFRLAPELSVRLGYANVSSAFTEAVRDNNSMIYTSGTVPNYVIDRGSQYFTGGLGFRQGSFFADAAFVWKTNRQDAYLLPAVWDSSSVIVESVRSRLFTHTYKFLFTFGYKF